MSKNNKTTVSINENLSALLDDEAGDFEQRRVLDELCSNKEFSKKFSSYALIGETMRSASVDKNALNAGSSFLAGIHEQIGLEDEFHDVKLEQQQASREQKSWLRPVGGLALAASVAAITVLGMQNYQLTKTNNEQILAATSLEQKNNQAADNKLAIASSEVADATVIENDAFDLDQYVEADSQTKSFLKSYVDSHMQYASHTTFVPSVRVIAYADYK